MRAPSSKGALCIRRNEVTLLMFVHARSPTCLYIVFKDISGHSDDCQLFALSRGWRASFFLRTAV